MRQCAALILAAGMGTRMKSALCKVLHFVAGRPMILYVLDAVRAAAPDKVAIVVGHQGDKVRACVGTPDIDCVSQEPQLGTGHAVAAAESVFDGFSGDILILCGDVPLLEPETLRRFIQWHQERNSRLTVLTTIPGNPSGYGRIIRDESGHISRIVEEKDANEQEKGQREINTGVYLVEATTLFSLLKRVGNHNAQKEYYLTDIIAEAVKESIGVEGFVLEDSRQALGINTRADLASASAAVWERRREELMDSGVTLLDPVTVYVDHGVVIGCDTVVHPFVTISGDTEIGCECVVESGVSIFNSRIGNQVNILQGSRLDGAVVDDETTVGPMANLRPESKIGKKARIGNFVEVKKTVVGDGSKVAHLTYLGDSHIGKDVNIGCGTITCNYDGKHKHQTIIHDKCFVGSDVQFVAPVVIGEGSLIGAGSTITKDVPPRSLALSRAKQRVYPLRKSQGSNSSNEDREP
jgi:bifunctional UDP-N-acetylglucosamine pyrophosphorylase / glucosamine-1-phosphate N-acetyltransferase